MIINNSQYTRLRNLNSTYTKTMERLQRELSTGNRINSAADDVAGLMVSERLKTKINTFNKGTQNLLDAKSMIQTVDGKYENSTAILQRMKELSIQYQNGTFSDLDKNMIKQEIYMNQIELNRTLQNITFNNKNVTIGEIPGKLVLKDTGDVVVIKDNPRISVISNEITMEAKVTIDSAPDSSVTDRWIAVSKNQNYYLTIGTDRKVAIYKYGSVPEKYWKSSIQVPIGTETHIAASFDDNKARIYINGILDSEFPLSKGGFRDNHLDLHIGFERPGMERQFQGSIDDVRIYNKALNEEQIQGNKEGNVTRDGLVGEWLFNEGGGSTIFDTSGNGNNGYISGGAKIVEDEGVTSNKSLNFHTGQDGSENYLNVNFPMITLNNLGLENLDNLGPEFLNTLDRAIDTLIAQRTYAGSILNKIDFRLQNNAIANINHSSTKQKILETDMSVSLSELTKLELKQSATLSILGSKIKFDQGKLNLLQS
ncbi:LamG-like jellyroll fold domain-containing protein [Bacillus cereus]|uniref:LamG-like jellyroll fold domain-containing protein n=1 Tax=Bacillus cereus TaxID=1396 RepID=UPI000B4BF7F8|nr:LamG-like jellyroll fold domain-containing protein [Bacillus cereus]